MTRTKRWLHRLPTPLATLVFAVGLAWPCGHAAAAEQVLTLDEALAIATDRQPKIQAAAAEVVAAVERTRQARAGYLPRLDAQAAYQRSTANFLLTPTFARSSFAGSINLSNRLGVDDTVGYTTFGASATQTLYDFGRTGGAMDQARAGEEAARQGLRLTGEQVALLVRTAYFEKLAADDLLAVRQRAVANQEKHVEQIHSFVEAGTRPKIDLRSAELNLATSQLALARAKNQAQVATVTLATSMGVDDLGGRKLVAPAAAPVPEENSSDQALVDKAWAERPELKQLSAQLGQQAGFEKSISSGYFPVLGILGTVNAAKVESFPLGLNWALGASMTWNLFAGLSQQARTAEVNAVTKGLQARHGDLRLAIRQQVISSRLSLAEAAERITLAERAAETAEQRLLLAEGRYQAGEGSILELDDAQVSHDQAQVDRVSATYDLAIARAQLIHALGRK